MQNSRQGYDYRNTFAATEIVLTIWRRLQNVSMLASLYFIQPLIPVADFRSKFSAIHREYSPLPRKFYGFCTTVTVCPIHLRLYPPSLILTL